MGSFLTTVAILNEGRLTSNPVDFNGTKAVESYVGLKAMHRSQLIAALSDNSNTVDLQMANRLMAIMFY